MIMESEIWKDIIGFEGCYRISNFGRIKSVERVVKNRFGSFKIAGGIRKLFVGTSGYLQINLRSPIKKETKQIHLLVWDYFGNGNRNGIKIQVDHIDNDKTNNRVDNLQLLLQRDNIIKVHRNRDLPTGVYRSINKYFAKIRVKPGEKYKYLGTFKTAEMASQAYIKEKINLEAYK